MYFTDDWVEAKKAVWDFRVDLNPNSPHVLEEAIDQSRFEVIEASRSVIIIAARLPGKVESGSTVWLRQGGR